MTQIEDDGSYLFTEPAITDSSCSLMSMTSNTYEPPAGFNRLAKQVSFSLSGCSTLAETVQVTIDVNREALPEGAIAYRLVGDTLTAIDDINIDDNTVTYSVTDNDGLYDVNNALGDIEGSVIWAVRLQAVESIPVVPVWLMSLMAGLLSVLGIRQFRVNRK